MSIPRVRGLLPVLLVVLAPFAAAAGAPPGQAAPGAPIAAAAASVREYRQVFRTYPYSDPNPIPVVGRIYPYYRFDGYTDTPVNQAWTVVELENAYLRVQVLPEIGGKIWAAFEKSTGRSFLYNNRVVKFRDVAMRGPWTSGGIEPNYGIMGHTPNCATPVDYHTRTNADGSATVVIGTLDLLTRTTWRLEVTLPADRAYFTTRSFWYNGTPLEQPYYTWMNAGIKAAGNLELIYPGTHHLGHGGEAAPWPIEPATGRNLAFYEQNNFGPYKSYHVVGRHTDFFGAYWHDDGFGMGRVARRDEKLGKKAWIWGLSRQGMIWEQLLTDEDGQYVEVQSGRLFNQAASESSATPFKHLGFAPYTADRWTEYWFPVKGTAGFVHADEHGALNVTAGGGRLRIAFSPLEAIDDTLEVRDGSRVIFSARVSLRPLETWTRTIDADVPADRIAVRIGQGLFEYDAAADDRLSRPVEAPAGFDWNSVFGLWTTGKQWIRQREHARAREALEAALRKDPHYLPALGDLAMLEYRERRDQAAWDLARRGLAIDTYDPLSNFVYGLASRRLGRAADARDGFEVAALSPAMRAAAWTELAKGYLAEGDPGRASEYAGKAAGSDPDNLDAIQVAAVAARLRKDDEAADAHLERLAAVDPLNHAARFERYLRRGTDEAKQAFVSGVRNELAHETFLELAAWYESVARPADARQVLSLAPPSPEVLYWQAYLASGENDPAAGPLLRLADEASPALAFPFRAESEPVFRWAAGRSPGWKPKYYLALVHWALNDAPAAHELLAGLGGVPDYAPFYALRAEARRSASPQAALADLERAATLDPGAWRYGKLLAEHFLQAGQAERARAVAARYHANARDNHVLGMLHARTLLLTGRYAEADALLRTLKVLPFEGATDGRALYREAQLMIATEAIRDNRLQAFLERVAAAREWPEHLGAGKPYPENVDERLEDWLEAMGLERLGRQREARTILERLATPATAREGFGRLLEALALQRLGRQVEAEARVEAWGARATDATLAAWGRQVLAAGSAPLPPGRLEPAVVAAVLSEMPDVKGGVRK